MPRMTYEHLQRQIQKLQAQAKKLEASRDSKKNKAVSQVTALMKKLGITVEDLPKTNAKPAKSGQNRKVKQSPKTRGPVAPKYRDPETGQTWTGRGKPPVWLSARLAQGRNKEEFLLSSLNENAQPENPQPAI
ncbi:MAG: H-NS histone family protein [Betaproteobacteria bacterium]|jgi:DNA-binding protein H-NS|nr:H-NS histone family protein [Betaproteobacteria bacterium]NBT98510.1 H-NS histone family protein [Betaproteobacteria bacterium]NCW85357.1 H-NS histone family protein [Oxalobacteraceae bacterium]NDG06328.1 H-NS histone family protein [Oxalobacteraceae bacterium]